jgi:hypothetical protein
MSLRRTRGDNELVSDLGVTQSTGDLRCDFTLTSGKYRQRMATHRWQRCALRLWQEPNPWPLYGGTRQHAACRGRGLISERS